MRLFLCRVATIVTKGGIFVDNKRAKEIANSPNMVDVTYNGTKIYIDSVDEPNECCVIHFIDQPVTRLNVPLSDLKEL